MLMADHQTTGGYPKIATVVDADLDRFAQCRPGTKVRFKSVTPSDAAILTKVRDIELNIAKLEKLAKEAAIPNFK